MNTILVPTDFSSVAYNAALYAINFAKGHSATTVVLYNAYQTPVNVDPAMPTIQLLDIEELKRSSIEGLENFRQQLLPECGDVVQLTMLSEFNLLAENINGVCEKTNADLIIMGITGKSKVEEVLIGSNTISVIEHTRTPVIIVPADSSYTPIEDVVFACDYKKVEETTPVATLKNVLEKTKANLHVVHVEKSDAADTAGQSALLQNLLRGINAKYHNIKGDDFVETINQFAADVSADLIITIPKKHGWLESLFRTRHTKKLAFHSHVPLMVIHD